MFIRLRIGTDFKNVCPKTTKVCLFFKMFVPKKIILLIIVYYIKISIIFVLVISHLLKDI